MRYQDKSLKAMLKHVQEKIVNPYIRERDQENFGVSISDNGTIDDAGHFFSVGANSGMRFRIDNIHGQSRSDNYFKSGNLLEYRINLTKRHGADYVEKLERARSIYRQLGHKWNRFSVIAIAETYKYLKKNKIWIFDQKEFEKIKEELINTNQIKI